ncbi:MAG: helix-turn-helix domain-containing protein [Acidimicrobiales bacterium]|jgi:transcriptional regulator with XRE-family HTH domain|nr:helix-turn-helix domain-containing protein [Acidimicrobiales bacterium]
MATVTDPTLVPPLRLGRLLRSRRETAGRSLGDLAAQGPGVSVALLEDIEAGRVDLSEAELARIAPLYEVDLAHVLPQRMQLVIDLDAGRLSVTGADASGVLLPGEEAEQVLVRYLALLYALRGMPVGTPLPLRRLDLDVLADALALRTDEVHDRLRDLMLQSDDRVRQSARGLRRRLVVPLAGILVAVTAAGSLLFVAEDGVAPVGGMLEPSAVVTVDEAPLEGVEPVEVELGDAVVAERDPATGEVVQRPR